MVYSYTMPATTAPPPEDVHDEAASEDEDNFFANMFDTCSPGQDVNPDAAPEGACQFVYWTDGMTIWRMKKEGKWSYWTEDEDE